MVIWSSVPWQAAGGIAGAVTGKVLQLEFVDSNITLPATAPFSLARPFVSSPGASICLLYDGTVWHELWRYPLGITKTLTWYGATTSGGAVTTQFTLTIVGGVITGATP